MSEFSTFYYSFVNACICLVSTTDGVDGQTEIWYRLSADVQDSESAFVPGVCISGDCTICGCWPCY